MNQIDPSGREQAYTRIKSLIATGELGSDDALSERSLAERLGLGRTPVREAMKGLAREGLLEVVPMRGTFLRLPSIDDLREIYEVRLAIEGMAAFLVAQRGPPPELLAYRRRLSPFLRATGSVDIDAMHQAGWEFHEAIVAATGNRRMLQTYELLRLPIMALRSGRPVDARQARTSLREHLSILDALETGDGALAQTRIMDHLAGVLEARARPSRAAALPAGAEPFIARGEAPRSNPLRTTQEESLT